MITALNLLVLAISSFLTLSILPHFGIFYVVPLIPLYFIIPLSYFRKGFEPVLLAALTGAFLDLFSGYPFGFFLALFLFVSLVVRLLFMEGMRSLSFWHYLLILGLSLLAFYGVQTIFLMANKIPIRGTIALSVLWGLGINLLCGILFYAFTVWYFERAQEFGDYIRRR